MANIDELIQRSQDKQRLRQVVKSPQNAQDSTAPVLQPGQRVSPFQQSQVLPVGQQPQNVAQRLLNTGQNIFSFLGQAQKTMLKSIFWEIPKDTVIGFETLGAQSIWAITGQKGGIHDSPLAKRFDESQVEVSKTWAAIRNPGLSAQALEQEAAQIRKDHPFLTFAPGPVNDILNMTILGEAEQLGLKAITKTAGEIGSPTKALASGLRQMENFFYRKGEKVLTSGAPELIKSAVSKAMVPHEVISDFVTSLKSSLEFGKWWKSKVSLVYNENSIFQKALTDHMKNLRIPQEQAFDWLEGIPQFKKFLESGQTVEDFLKAGKSTKVKYDAASMDTMNWLRSLTKRDTKVLTQRSLLVAQQAYERTIAPLVKQFIESKLPETVSMSLKDALPIAEKAGLGTDEAIFSTVGDLAKKLKIDPVYFQHFFENKMRLYESIVPTSLHVTRGGYRKPFALAPGYEKDVTQAATRHNAQVQNDIFTKNIVSDLMEGRAPVKSFRSEQEVIDAGLQGKYSKWESKGNLGFFPAELSNGNTIMGVTRNVPEVWLPNSEARVLNKFFEAKGMAEKIVNKTLDPVIDVWRFNVLAMAPRWFINNTIGNFILNSLAGVSPLDYVRFGFKKLDYVPETIRMEVEKGLYQTQRRGIGEIAKGFNKVSQPLYGVNQKIENTFRTVNFSSKAHRLANDIVGTLSPEVVQKLETVVKKTNFDNITEMIISQNKDVQRKAIEQVNKFLFDYSALSPFERQWIRRAQPFYSWYKNIFRLTGQLAYENPGRLALMYRAYQSLGPIDDPDLPDWIKGRVPTPLSFKDPSTGDVLPVFLSIKAAMPFSDLLKISDPEALLSSINPVAKIAIERTFKRSLFKGAPFTSPYYEPNSGTLYDPKTGESKKIQPLPGLMRHIGQQLPWFTFIDDVTHPYSKFSTGEPILSADGQIRYPQDVQYTILKMFGLNLLPFDVGQYIESQKNQKETIQRFGEKVTEKYQTFQLNQNTKKKVNDRLQHLQQYNLIHGSE